MRASRLRVCCHPSATPIKRIPTDSAIEGTPEELDAIRLHLDKINKLLRGLFGPIYSDEPESLQARSEVADIIEQQRFCRTNTIQICDHLSLGTHRDLRDALRGIGVVQVIHVTGPESVEEAACVAPHVDAILLDSGNQKLAVKELGGTGRTHDWTLSRAIRERIEIPLFLAGGLTPENLGQAIEEVHPFALDVCSGVRTDGKLDATKLKRFFLAVRNAGP